jgi:hypothetical protein
VPRGFLEQYIPGWEENCENLYQDYNINHDSCTANRLLEELNKQRKKKWEVAVESTSFVQSSRKAWNLLRKLGADSKNGVPLTHQITANTQKTMSRILRQPKHTPHVFRNQPNPKYY